MNLTPQQLLAVQEGEPLRFTVPDVTGEFVVVRDTARGAYGIREGTR